MERGAFMVQQAMRVSLAGYLDTVLLASQRISGILMSFLSI